MNYVRVSKHVTCLQCNKCKFIAVLLFKFESNRSVFAVLLGKQLNFSVRLCHFIQLVAKFQ